MVSGDAATLGFPDASFDTVATCTMLHHLPTRARQDRVLAEAFRVLRPGGTFLGSDSLPSDDLHHFHEGDTYNPVEPAAFLTRLQTDRLHRDHPAGRAQPDLHRPQGEPTVSELEGAVPPGPRDERRGKAAPQGAPEVSGRNSERHSSAAQFLAC